MNRQSHCQWTSAFFGLGDKYREYLWDEIFELAYNSNGGFTHDEIYSMPTPKRKYYIKKLIHRKKEEQKQSQSNNNKVTPGSMPKIKKR